MITDNETDFLFLADTLKTKYPVFCSGLEKLLIEVKISFDFIPYTRDVWVVDFMPIQVRGERFVQFVYLPGYLTGSKKWSATISDVETICNSMHLDTVKSKIKVDGGNIVRSIDTVIMCDKVFKENSDIPKKKLIKELENILEVGRVIFLPQDPNDIFGHADGMVRFLDSNTVVMNRYGKVDNGFGSKLKTSLRNAGLDYIEVPYNPYSNKKDIQANGTYINYLEMKGLIIVPTFDMIEDEKAIIKFEELFKGKSIRSLNSKNIAKDGGVLNCITWNIQL